MLCGVGWTEQVETQLHEPLSLAGRPLHVVGRCDLVDHPPDSGVACAVSDRNLERGYLFGTIGDRVSNGGEFFRERCVRDGISVVGGGQAYLPYSLLNLLSRWRSIIGRSRSRDLEIDLDGIVGNKRAFCPSRLLKMDDIVLNEYLEVVVD